MRFTDPTSETSAASGAADTPLSRGFRPEVLVGPEHERRRRAVEAALFGGAAEAVSFGRYRLLHRLGEGGMGTVYAAYDDHLDRKIALKLIRSSKLDSAEVRERTLREARALARLSHPNVVHVYEVGEIEGQLFVAMEFLAGPTLRTWLDGQERPWREALAVLRQAGEGLAAAHAQGIVHRDFKPHNAMFGADGRVRVLDFGLARLGEGEEPGTAAAADKTARPNSALTLTGTLLGTPAYMAPEQFQRRLADARSDQFAFCVTLYEALYGKRPFAGESLAALAEEITTGRVAARPKDSRVPQWVHSALLRGLQTDPAKRWPSMRELLAALERDPRARLRRIATAVALLTGSGAIAGGIEGYRRWDVAERIAACEAEGAAIDAVWNDEARTRLREAFAATGLGYAVTSAEKMMPWLDEAAAAWKKQRTEVCLNAEVHETWGENLVDSAMWCLEDRQQALQALVSEFSTVDARSVGKAVRAAANIRSSDSCTDASLLERQPAPPAAGREILREVRAEIVRAGALESAGKYKEAAKVATAARERADESVEWAPLRASARLSEGNNLSRMNNYEAAEAAITAAYFEAARAGAWDIAARAATSLVGITNDRARPAEAMAWAKHAELAIAHAGDRAGLREASRLVSLANVHSKTKVLAEAQPLLERALELYEQALGPDDISVAVVLNNLGNVLSLPGKKKEAKPLFERALAIGEKMLGPDHPQVAASLDGLAGVITSLDERPRAREYYERALKIRESALGPHHAEVAVTLNNIALLLEREAPAEARSLYERALAIVEKIHGPDHPQVAMMVNNLALLHSTSRAYAEAQPLYERALAIFEKTEGYQGLFVDRGLQNLAIAHEELGQYAEARKLFERLLERMEKQKGRDHEETAVTLIGLARVHLLEKKPRDALSLIERSVALFEAKDGVQLAEPSARFVLAKALVANRGDRARALAEARRALAGYREVLWANQPSDYEDVEKWLAEHEPKK